MIFLVKRDLFVNICKSLLIPGQICSFLGENITTIGTASLKFRTHNPSLPKSSKIKKKYKIINHIKQNILWNLEFNTQPDF